MHQIEHPSSLFISLVNDLYLLIYLLICWLLFQGQTGSSFLHFAEEQARKEVELAGVKRQKQQVETALRQLQDKHANSVQNYQEEMENLRDEVDRWQRNR